MKKYLILIVSIGLCLGLGKVCAWSLGLLPASLYGMMFFAGLLACGVLDEQAMGAAIAKVIYFMPVVFLPVCVGVMQYFELLADVGLVLLGIGISTSLIAMLVVGKVANKLLAVASDD